MQENLLDLIEYIVPETLELLSIRYNMLRYINLSKKIGRRSLSIKTGVSERIIRRESMFLKERDLIDINSEGMVLKEKGFEYLEKLEVLFDKYNGITDLEKRVADILNIRKVIIAPTINEIGKYAADYLKLKLKDNITIGLTGGTSVGSVVERFSSSNKSYQDIMVVPARGALGNSSNYQANTLVEKFAKKINADYKVLYTFDCMSEEMKQTLLKNQEIMKVVEAFNNLDILVFGIGRADIMAEKRKLDDKILKIIKEKKAISESFGYYFDKCGKIVYEINTIGIDLNSLHNVKELIAVAGGEDKLDAILSISNINKNITLVTDKSVANQLLTKGVNHEKKSSN